MTTAFRGLGRSPLVQTFALMILLCMLGISEVHDIHSMSDPDIWWHVRVGQWILEHHSVPHVGIFSQIGENTPWAAYSWGYEIVVTALKNGFGLKGLPIFSIAMGTVFTLVLFLVTCSLSNSFWRAWLLTAVAIMGANPGQIVVVRPVAFSILFFTIELGLVLKAQQTGDRKYLYWLPPLFLIWANFHIQFLYGLLVPGLLVLAAIAGWASKRWPRVSSFWIPAEEADNLRFYTGIFLVCLLATLVNPYGIGLYRTIATYMRSSYTYEVIEELQAPNFRQIPHYVELLLVATGFFVLGRSRTNLFRLTLLTVASVVSFRTVRDAWFVCIVVAAVLAGSPRVAEAAESDPPKKRHPIALRASLAMVGAICIIALRAWDAGLSNENLLKVVRGLYPLDAVGYIHDQHPPGPLMNDLNWGGFLIAFLPDYPVSIDGRNDLYGDEFLRHSRYTLGGLDWTQDPQLARSRLILLPVHTPICRLLRESPQFKLVYADRMATVFIRIP